MKTREDREKRTFFGKVWGVFLETARIFGDRCDAPCGLAEASRGRALKTREDAKNLEYLAAAARGKRKARERSAILRNRNHG